MTADVSPDAPRPPSGIRDSGGPMPFNEADFTRTAAELVAEGDRVPTQRSDEHEIVGQHGPVAVYELRCACGFLAAGISSAQATAAYDAHLSVASERMRA